MTVPQQQPVAFSVKLPFTSPEDFLARYGGNVTLGGIYLRSKTVRPPGTEVTLDLKLADGAPVLRGTAVVDFVTGQQGEGLPGMGLRFHSLSSESRQLLELAARRIPAMGVREVPLPQGVGPAQRASPSTTSADATAGGPPLAPSRNVVKAPEGKANGLEARTLVASAGGPALQAPAFQEPTEEPARTGPVIGIDLGTSNSCASLVLPSGKPAVLQSREGHNTVPSIIALNQRSRLVVGHPAKGQMLTNPRLTVYGAKRLMGRPVESQVVREIQDRFHYEIVGDEQGEAAVQLSDRVYTLAQVSALILREVKEVAQNRLTQPVSRAVITVPAYYNERQRQTVREAGRLAGLHVERIVNEPTAAALAYGYGRNLQQRVLVYDLGGGTFDASVLELSDNVYEVISTGGDAFLGGFDFDMAIVGHLLEQFEAKTGHRFDGDRVALQRIRDAAERAKCSLSERTEIRVHVPFITLIEGQPYDLDVVLDRATLNSLTESLVDRTMKVCEEVMAAKGLTPAEIDEIVLVGGQSRFPLVHQKITALFGKPPSKGVHPDEAVAIGASLLAQSLGELDGVVLIDVLPMSIGIGLPGGRLKAIIERNATLPVSKRYGIATTRDGQTELELAVFQGDVPLVEEAEYLGSLRLAGLPPGPRGSVRVEVTFEVSAECLLTVTAKELSTGKVVQSTFTTRDTPDAVRQRLAEQARESGDAEAETTGADTPPGAESSRPRGGLLGWLRKLFGGGD